MTNQEKIAREITKIESKLSTYGMTGNAQAQGQLNQPYATLLLAQAVAELQESLFVQLTALKLRD